MPRYNNFYVQTCKATDVDGKGLLHVVHNAHGYVVKFNNLTIAYSCQKKLWDILCPTKLLTPSMQSHLQSHQLSGSSKLTT